MGLSKADLKRVSTSPDSHSEVHLNLGFEQDKDDKAGVVNEENDKAENIAEKQEHKKRRLLIFQNDSGALIANGEDTVENELDEEEEDDEDSDEGFNEDGTENGSTIRPASKNEEGAAGNADREEKVTRTCHSRTLQSDVVLGLSSDVPTLGATNNGKQTEKDSDESIPSVDEATSAEQTTTSAKPTSKLWLIAKLFSSKNSKPASAQPFSARDVQNMTDLDNSLMTNPLPYFVVYITWVLVLATMATCAFFLLLYSMQWGSTTSQEWLASFFLSFFQSFFVFEPVKVKCCLWC
jgi:hypothetical protein